MMRMYSIKDSKIHADIFINVNILLFHFFLRLHTKEISLISARYCTVLIMMDKTVTLISGETGFLVEIKR